MFRRPETKAAEEKVYKQKQICEFMSRMVSWLSR